MRIGAESQLDEVRNGGTGRQPHRYPGEEAPDQQARQALSDDQHSRRHHHDHPNGAEHHASAADAGAMELSLSKVTMVPPAKME